MKKISSFFRTLGYVILRVVLMGFIRVAFRPKVIYASDRARELAFAQPRVIIVNHVRGWDGGVVYTGIHRQKVTALIAKDMIEGSRGLQLLVRFLPALPIDREHASLQWLRDSRKTLKDGRSIMIFPEGKCQFDRVMKPFKSGCVMLAATAKVSVLPIYHNGMYKFFIGKRFRMIIGEPIELTPGPEGLRPDEMDREAEQLFRAMNDLELRLTGHVRRLNDDGTVKEE